MEPLITTIVKGLVDDKENITISRDETLEDGTVVYKINVSAEDMGRVIGKQGRVAKAIRTVVRAAAMKTGEKAMVEIG